MRPVIDHIITVLIRRKRRSWLMLLLQNGLTNYPDQMVHGISLDVREIRGPLREQILTELE